MTTLTNSEGRVSAYTNDVPEIILLQLGSSNSYYTSGEHGIIFYQIGSDKTLLLYYIHFNNINIFQNYTINEHPINNYGL